MRKRIPFLFMVLTAVFWSGCSAPSRNVSRLEVDETTDISGRWNDTDSRMTAEAMIKDVLSRPWLNDFTTEFDKKPVVIVGSVRNKSSEHIPVDLFIKDMEKELINSGQVTFVASSLQREEIRNERLDQQSNASMETAKQLANETGADFMLQGLIDSIEDSFEGKKAVYYQVNLELIDLEKNTKVWIGDKKIKKLVEQSRYKW
ncbi:MAG: penicillin-binding protein activator LpoB [Calditrichaeota bacterium]|nr:MAG: penicillin-binding protein activator LpoB [Calditrichota bacterium]